MKITTNERSSFLGWGWDREGDTGPWDLQGSAGQETNLPASDRSHRGDPAQAEHGGDERVPLHHQQAGGKSASRAALPVFLFTN